MYYILYYIEIYRYMKISTPPPHISQLGRGLGDCRVVVLNTLDRRDEVLRGDEKRKFMKVQLENI